MHCRYCFRRNYPYDDVPRGGELPYLTIGQSSVRDWSTGSEDGEEHTLTLHIWSRASGRRQVQEIMGVVGTALKDAAPSVFPALRAAGVMMLLVGAAYAVLCLRRGGRPFRWRGRRIAPPRAPVVAWQLAVSSANWLLMGLIVWLLLQQALPYTTVLAVLLLAAVAGVVTHVPAGLGVLEAVFVACLGSQLPTATLLAALVTYRAVYYLAPLVPAAAGYAIDETAVAPRDFHH